MQLQGSADYMNGQMSAGALLGMTPARQSKAAGQSTPPVTAAGGDRQMVPWSPDSPGFWLAVVAGLTVAGMAAADVRVRLFKRTAAASVGKT
jgi:hypothetical protein